MSSSPQLELIAKWNKGFEDLDATLFKEHMHNDFTYATYPKSLKMPEQNKEQWCSQIAQVIGMWASMEREVFSVTEAPGKVITHYSGKATMKFPGDPVFREGITIATIVPDGEGNLKIKRIEEFIDSDLQLKTMARMSGKCKGGDQA